MLLFCGSVFAENQPLIPLDEIARLPQFSSPKLSPNGKYIAFTQTENGKIYIITKKLGSSNEGENQFLAKIGTDIMKFSQFDWANNERLLIKLRSTVGYRGDLRNLNRIGTIHRDGIDPVIFNMKPNDWGYFRQHTEVVDWLENDPEHILAALDDEPRGWAQPRVHKVNVVTGKREIVARNFGHIYDWYADPNGDIRIGVRYKLTFGKSDVEILHRKTIDDNWETLQEVSYFDKEKLIPYRFDKEDPNILLVVNRATNAEDENKELFKYDLTTNKVVGNYVNEKRKKLIDLVEKAFPDLQAKIISLNQKEDMAFFAVYSDIFSPEYYLLDLQRKSLDFVAAEYPHLINYQLSPMSAVSYTASDGVEIPAFLTLPAESSGKDMPLIVFPHGGPWAHDEWGFDNYVQFMANRGYAVFQPQFRGSTGYGIEHEQAGYGEWGQTIQDDITDGVEWLIKTGVADPERICIVGESFGGYAAAMGTAKTPDLYKCAISVNGVLDLKLYIDSGRKMVFENINRAMWNSRKEAEETSPYHLAENIKAPVLLIASERDTVVPVKHSRKMYKRLKKLDVEVEYVELPDGEHWRTNERHELIKLEAIEKFLATHLGSAQVPTKE
ncbi:MAG: S9 family peptidase [Gammaproteobacteria bacterium]|nr:S9 family peptidase [Gammaproteobacteria bacterium]MCP4091473.1 S9 family peptidase [Gammaproteobacteria bacterium]MCP4275384.1 S9 family peptidase [Gammaproteobacteria bacterium]